MINLKNQVNFSTNKASIYFQAKFYGLYVL